METPHICKGLFVNHIKYDFLTFLSSTFRHWQDNFKTMPIVYVGIGRPQHKLTTNQRFVAGIGVTVVGAVIEYFLDKADLEDRREDYNDSYDDADDDEDQDDYEEESSA